MYKDIKELSNKKNKASSSGCIKGKDGKLLFETEDVKNRWCEYTGELFADTRPEKPNPPNLDGPKILPSEVRKAIKNSKTGKTAFTDQVTSELTKSLEEF